MSKTIRRFGDISTIIHDESVESVNNQYKYFKKGIPVPAKI